MTGDPNCPILEIFNSVILNIRDQILNQNAYRENKTPKGNPEDLNANWRKIASDLKRLSNILEDLNLFKNLSKHWKPNKNISGNIKIFSDLIKKKNLTNQFSLNENFF